MKQLNFAPRPRKKNVYCAFLNDMPKTNRLTLFGVFFPYRTKAKNVLSVIKLVFRQDVDALGTLNVQPTVVKVKTHVPYYNLKVSPQCIIIEN